MYRKLIFLGISLGVANNSVHAADADAVELDHNNSALEEIIVTSTLHRSQADTTLPVNVLLGEALRERIGATLGDTLQDQIGVTTASFGAGVGSPVIRGQGANRAQVLQGGIGNIDASSVSADHANSLEPALAERIEVLRGPATLLYGNGAIGGVVNVIDNRIPTTLPDGIDGLLETRHDSASDQQVHVMKLEGAAGRLAWHVDGVRRDSNDVEINGFAINPDNVDVDDSEALEQLLDSRGRLDNSSMKAEAKTLGASWMLEQGYVGLAVNKLDNNYGIPAAAHAQHEHADEEHEDEELEEAEDGIRLVMEQERVDFETRLALTDLGVFNEIHGRISHVEYQHSEVEGNGEIGTVFEQDGSEGRFALHFNTSSDAEGVLGLQVSQRKFSAVGAEAFIPATDVDTLGLFAVQSIEVDNRIYEFGLRGERQSLQQTRGGCDEADTNFSASAASIWRVRDDTNLVMSLAHSQRSATVEERFSNIDSACNPQDITALVAHAATQRLEIGNPNADQEQSTNIELALRKHLGAVTGEITLYYNDIGDFIYLNDTDQFVDDIEISRYEQQDAVFSGFEAELSVPLLQSGAHLTELGLFSDYVRAKFNSAGNVPQIPPLSYGAELRHSHTHWQAKLRISSFADQNKTTIHETDTDGYVLIGFYADYHLDLGDDEAFLFLKGSNLLDETIRHHTSLLKDVAPAAGRAIEVGLRWEF